MAIYTDGDPLISAPKEDRRRHDPEWIRAAEQRDDVTLDGKWFGCVSPAAMLASVEEANMPRTSPYPIVLTNEERAELDARARAYSSPYRDVVRARIVLMAADGLDNATIGARLDTPRQIVSKWRKRFYEAGLVGLEEQPRGGRPATFPPRGGRRGQGTRV